MITAKREEKKISRVSILRESHKKSEKKKSAPKGHFAKNSSTKSPHTHNMGVCKIMVTLGELVNR